MRKNNFFRIKTAFLSVVVSYTLTVFITLNPNPFTWGIEFRVLAVAFFISCFGISGIAQATFPNKDTIENK